MENVIFLGIGVVMSYVGFHVLHDAKVKIMEEEIDGKMKALYGKRFIALAAEFETSKAEFEAWMKAEVAKIEKKFKGSK